MWAGPKMSWLSLWSKQIQEFLGSTWGRLFPHSSSPTWCSNHQVWGSLNPHGFWANCYICIFLCICFFIQPYFPNSKCREVVQKNNAQNAALMKKDLGKKMTQNCSSPLLESLKSVIHGGYHELSWFHWEIHGDFTPNGPFFCTDKKIIPSGNLT